MTFAQKAHQTIELQLELIALSDKKSVQQQLISSHLQFLTFAQKVHQTIELQLELIVLSDKKCETSINQQLISSYWQFLKKSFKYSKQL